MPKTEINPQELRRLAEALVDEMDADGELPEAERADIATSLVRQWLTYDGRAILFHGEEQVCITLGRTPLGRPCVVPESAGRGWVRLLARDWKIHPDDLPEVLDQLNRGQSAEVVNADDVPLRLWVNPGQGRRGVEPLAPEAFRPEAVKDYIRVAADTLEDQLGEGLDPGEMEQLCRSVAKQWEQYDGHASLFLDGHRRLDLRLDEHGDGTCEVVATRASTDLERFLSSLGLPPKALPGLIAKINLGEAIGVRDSDGVDGVLWYDPRAGRVCVRRMGLVSPAMPAVAPPVFCPDCRAVLGLWRDGENQKNCTHCGHAISLTDQPTEPCAAPPVFCPSCRGVLKPWQGGEGQQTCYHCGHTISLR
jgi:hypothetical protein